MLSAPNAIKIPLMFLFALAASGSMCLGTAEEPSGCSDRASLLQVPLSGTGIKEFELLQSEHFVTSEERRRQTLSPEDALSLYQLTHKVARILEKLGITYWAAAGTLLGMLRNKGIIPHDNDVDLNILDSVTVEMRNADSMLRRALRRNNITVDERHPRQWHLKPEEKQNNNVMIDIFAFQVNEAGEYQFRPDRTSTDSRTRVYPSDTPEQLQALPFGSSQLMAPSTAIAEHYLERVYGSTWRVESNCRATQHFCKLIDDAEWDLTGMALPSGPVEDPV